MKRPDLAAIAGGAVLLAGGFVLRDSATAFFRGYLLGFVFWAGLGLGALGLLLLNGLVGSGWGRVLRGPLAAAAGTLPVLAALWIPVLLSLQALYPWASPDAATDEILLHKRAYLNPGFFTVRSVLYLAAWSAMSVAAVRGLHRERAEGPDYDGGRHRILSGAGLVVFVLTATFASIDWIMSLEPHWFSAGYGLLVIAGQGLSALALGIVAVVAFSRRGAASEASHLNDLGNLLLAFLMIWAYLGFAQYLVIWSGNLPEEAEWYLHRSHGGWQGVAWALLLVHFAVPFLLLLSRRAKRDPRFLATIAAGLLAMRAVEACWLVLPPFSPGRFALHWLDLAGFLGIGGIWIGTWLLAFRGGAASLTSWPAVEEHAHA